MYSGRCNQHVLNECDSIAFQENPADFFALVVFDFYGFIYDHVHVFVESDYASFNLKLAVFVDPDPYPILFLEKRREPKLKANMKPLPYLQVRENDIDGQCHYLLDAFRRHGGSF